MILQDGHKNVAVLCLLEHDNQFLLLKRSKQPNKDLYTPVGGMIEPFETPEKAAIREVKEETGLDVKDLRYWGTLVESSPTAHNWISFVFHAEVDWSEPQKCDEGELEWIKQIQLNNLAAPKTDWHIYQYVLLKKPFAFHAEYSQQMQLIHMEEMLERKVLNK